MNKVLAKYLEARQSHLLRQFRQLGLLLQQMLARRVQGVALGRHEVVLLAQQLELAEAVVDFVQQVVRVPPVPLQLVDVVPVGRVLLVHEVVLHLVEPLQELVAGLDATAMAVEFA